ncbi:MAG: hypothetical protein O6941_03655 [Planctomycetota bacterium]|nr:hypothetical protein [Planctomycetota bacterium]
MKAGHHIVSLSLGTVAEPSALVVVQPSTVFSEPDEDGRCRPLESHFAVTWLERFPAGRPITAIAARACELISDKRLANNYTLLLDITSTGAAPAKVFEDRGVYPKAIDLSSTAEEQAGSSKRVPLRDVIGAAQVVLQTARLKVASELELAGTLVADLTAFDPKPVARNMDLRGGRNADLVFALAMTLWWGDKLAWDDDMSKRGRRRENYGPLAWMGM